MTFHEWQAIALRVAFNGLGWLGGVFVVYGVIASVTQPWPPLEHIATWLSSLLTVIGTVITAVTIYSSWSQTPHPPDAMSRAFTAPIVIVAGLIALALFIKNGNLPVVVVNGFAMLGLAGGLLRLQPRPKDW